MISKYETSSLFILCLQCTFPLTPLTLVDACNSAGDIAAYTVESVESFLVRSVARTILILSVIISASQLAKKNLLLQSAEYHRVFFF